MYLCSGYNNLKIGGYRHTRLHAGFSKVYGLKDLNGNYFYIGVTHGSLTMRLAQHLVEARIAPHHNWAKSMVIIDNDFNILIEELESVWMTSHSGKEILRRSKPLEDKWITEMIQRGFNLTNVFYNGKRNRPQFKSHP